MRLLTQRREGLSFVLSDGEGMEARSAAEKCSRGVKFGRERGLRRWKKCSRNAETAAAKVQHDQRGSGPLQWGRAQLSAELLSVVGLTQSPEVASMGQRSIERGISSSVRCCWPRGRCWSCDWRAGRGGRVGGWVSGVEGLSLSLWQLRWARGGGVSAGT